MKFHIFASVTFLYVNKTKSISSRERDYSVENEERLPQHNRYQKIESGMSCQVGHAAIVCIQGLAWNSSSIPVQPQWVCHLVPKRSACELMSAASSK